jgi:hypothetical protein
MCPVNVLLIRSAYFPLAALLVTLLAGADQEYFVSTIAEGAPPGTPVAATDAPTGKISGAAVDSAGNTYISSRGLHCVFKIDPAGVMTRFAATGRPGYATERDELVEISDFLWSHHYKVLNLQKWDFLRPDPPR